MADQLAALGIEIKTSGAEQAARKLDKLTTEAKKTDKAVDDLGNEFVQAGQQAGQLSSGLKRAEEVAKNARGGFRAMRGATQQLSYQLQDVAVQAQMGTDALRIMAQQGPQILSIFGPGGAIAGAIVAFGALIAGTLFASLEDAEDKTDALEDAMDRLNQTTVEAYGVFRGLSEEYERFARASAAVTIAMAASEVDKLQKVIDVAGKRATEAFVEFADAAELPIDSISAIRARFPFLQKAVEQAGGSMDDFMDTVYNRQPAITSMQEQISLLGEKFGLSAQEAYDFLETLAGLDTQATPEALASLLEQTAQMSLGLDSSDKSLLRFIETLDETALVSKKAAGTMAAFQRVVESGDVRPELEGTKDFLEAEQRRFDQLLDADMKASEKLREQRERQGQKDSLARQRRAEADKRLEQKITDDLLAADIKASEERKQAKEQAQKILSTLFSEQSPEVIAFARQQQSMLELLERANQKQLISNQTLAAAKAQIEQDYYDKVEQIRLASEAREREANSRKLLEQMTLMERWYLETEKQINNIDFLQVQMAQSFEQNLGDAIYGLISGTQSFGEAFQAMGQAILKEFLTIVAQMIAKRIAFALIGGKIEQLSAAKLAAYQSALAQAKVAEAALNTFVSVAAIPVVGPAMAPGAAAAAAGIAGTMAGVVTAANVAAAAVPRATGGQVRGGQTYLVGERGPELLTMGGTGRISSNDQLKQAVGGGQSIQIVNNVDARGSGPDVDMKIRKAMKETTAVTMANIQDLMRRRRFA